MGDSPSDIIAGHENGVETLAVGTGEYSVDELRKFNPKHVFEDLSDTAEVVKLLLGN